MPKYVKVTFSLRQDLHERVELVMKANGLTRSAALALFISRVPLREILPKDFMDRHEGEVRRIEKMLDEMNVEEAPD